MIRAYAFAPILFSEDEKGNTTGNISTLFSLDPKSLRGKEAIDKIISGECRGVSPELKIEQFNCTICRKNIEYCTHKIGEHYGGKICRPIAMNIAPISCALVSMPKDPRCIISDLLVIELEDRVVIYHWYGFWVRREDIRFENIQRALDGELITENVALNFGKLFSVNLYGHATARAKANKRVKKLLQDIASIPVLT